MDECLREHLSMRQLSIRISQVFREITPPPAATPENIVVNYSRTVERFLDNTLMPEFLMDQKNLHALEPALRSRLRQQAMDWLEALDDRRNQCADLIARLENVMTYPDH